MLSLFPRSLGVAVTAAVVILLATSAGTPESAPAARAVTDDLGNTVHVPESPDSILSLSLFSDEVLQDILSPARFAAVHSLAVNPVYSNTAEKASQIDPVIEFNVEQIIDIYPDLVIAADWSEADKLDQLRQAGIPVYQVRTAVEPAGIRTAIRQLGELVGEPAAAAELIADFDRRKAALAEIVAAVPAEDRLQAMDYTTWGASAGTGTSWHTILELAGLDNAAAALKADDFGQVPLSKETLIELDPDILFLPGYVWGEPDGADAFYRQLRRDPAFADLQAIRNDRLYLFPERLKGTYSHYIIDAAEHAARTAYPQLF
ncbi:ABC transporter substrate-binding protein [Spirochaeta africana]|uniref:ABC-type Fe3+-hydroxamate transport system, periplasmic component n=1 Tax=Spirochaeta africana (strain ATCC 700263 / DSM 8902 / Z-7692) TaxID=889378 RepID=H9UL89_SPIAZ|nr:ABC transporter substrate-binding protein [Spirochaeta africana]AFG38282.1 ABC-type Fe3+-hydroxamate transport system, periplasmic component [Spirochaeta africana DSM 8902]